MQFRTGPARLRHSLFRALSAHLKALLPQNVGILLHRTPLERRLPPEIGRQEAVSVGHCGEGGLERVLEGLGRAGRRRVGVLDSGELEQTLDSRRGDEAGAARGWNKSDGDGAALSALLHGQRVRKTEVGTPVASPHGDDAELGNNDGGADGGSATSLEVLMPRPTWPSESPMMTMALNRVR